MDPIEQLKKGIAAVESGGKYTAIGPATSTGDKAYGKYQVMGANIPQWTKEATGTSYTTQDFLSKPDIQEAVATHRIGQLYNKFKNPADVASAWFSGRPLQQAGNASDVTGTSTPAYVKKVLENMGSGSQQSEGLSEDIKQKAIALHNQGAPTAAIQAWLRKQTQKSPDQSSQMEQSQQQPAPQQPQDQSLSSQALSDAKSGHWGDAISHGVRAFGNLLTGGGSEVLGQSLGTNLGYMSAPEKDKPFYDTTQPSVGDVTKAGLKTGGAVAALAGLPSLLGASSAGAAESPVVNRAFESYLDPAAGESVSTMSAASKVDALHNALSETGIPQSEKLVLQDALNKIMPAFNGEAGLSVTKQPGIIKSTLKNPLVDFVLYNLIEPKVKGLVKGLFSNSSNNSAFQ